MKLCQSVVPKNWQRPRLSQVTLPSNLQLILFLVITYQWGSVTSKQFERCEYIAILINHEVPLDDLGDWTCVTQWASNFTSDKIHIDDDGLPANYGILKIDNNLWCSDNVTKGMNYCNVECSDLLNTNLTDDIRCAQKITQKTGGFQAWPEWHSECQNRDLDIYTQGCIHDDSVKDKVLPVIEIPPNGLVVEFYTDQTGQSLTCSVLRVDHYHVEWDYDKIKYHDVRSSTTTLDSGEVRNHLYFPNVVTEQGNFTCHAWNYFGRDSKTFQVILTEPEQTPTTTIPYAEILPLIVVIVAIILCLSLIIYRKFLFKAYGLTDDEIQQFQYGVPSKLRKILQPNGKPVSQLNKEDFHYLPYDKRFEIDPGDLKIRKEEVLGSGHFGIVFKGTVKGKEVAIKTPKGPPDTATPLIKSLLTELKIMIHIGEHPNIVNLIGAHTGGLRKGQLFIAVEFCELGDLEQYLRGRQECFVDPTLPVSYICGGVLTSEATDKDPITFQDLLTWSIQIAAGMAHLESKKVMHGDLASRNVLLYKKDVAKISDFGLSRQLYSQPNYTMKECHLPWRWMAIETLTTFTFCSKTDIWSFGVTLWEIFSLGELPYPGMSWSLEFPALLKGGLRLLRPERATKKVYDVMLSCWNQNPQSRPDFTSLQNTLTEIKQDAEGSSCTIIIMEDDDEEGVYTGSDSDNHYLPSASTA